MLECQAAEDTAAELQTLLPGLHIGLVHGRMRPVEKQRVMEEFKAGILQLLVATTVIEVGVDAQRQPDDHRKPGAAGAGPVAPAARPGRAGSVASPRAALSCPLSKTAQSRLGVLRETNDGFSSPSGIWNCAAQASCSAPARPVLADLKIADLVRDQPLIPGAEDGALPDGQTPGSCRAPDPPLAGPADHYSNA